MAIGPTRIPASVLERLATPPPPIQAPTFVETLGTCVRGIRTLHGATGGAAFVLPGTGTAGMEALAVSFVPPGTDVAVVSTGYWGGRWSEICRRAGARVHDVIVDFRSPSLNEQLRRALDQNGCRIVYVTHVDSSSGLMVDLHSVAQLVHSFDAMLFVDSICGVGAERVAQAQWDVDAVLSSTPKAVGVPAGLFMLTLSETATTRLRQRQHDCRSLALDLQPWLDVMAGSERGEFGYFQSPFGNLVIALAEGIGLILEEGLDIRVLRHRRLAETLRDGLERLGIELLVPNAADRANGVTVAFYPPGRGAELLTDVARRGVFLPPGTLSGYSSRTFRIGHLGWVTAADIDATLSALEMSIAEARPIRIAASAPIAGG